MYNSRYGDLQLVYHGSHIRFRDCSNPNKIFIFFYNINGFMIHRSVRTNFFLGNSVVYLFDVMTEYTSDPYVRRTLRDATSEKIFLTEFTKTLENSTAHLFCIF